MDDVRSRRGNPNLARDVDHRIDAELAPARTIVHRPTLRLERHQRREIEPVLVGNCPAAVARGNDYRPFSDKKRAACLPTEPNP